MALSQVPYREPRDGTSVNTRAMLFLTTALLLVAVGVILGQSLPRYLWSTDGLSDTQEDIDFYQKNPNVSPRLYIEPEQRDSSAIWADWLERTAERRLQETERRLLEMEDCLSRTDRQYVRGLGCR